MYYLSMSKNELELQKEALLNEYNSYLTLELDINMTRGKPCTEQLDLTEDMLKTISSNEDCFTSKGFDCRNYGLVDGLDDAKKLFSPIISVPWEQIIVGGNSSLNLMYDAMARCMLYGTGKGQIPWGKQEKIKFLCPVPGYDRHFGICESLGIEMINVPLTQFGPDMDMVEKLVKDSSVKGMWCVPKYSNPTGITYSDETVKRIAALKPAATDFRIFWDNAYAVHDLYEDKQDSLLNLFEECEKAGNADLAYIFTSTSKISYPGSGVSCLGASKNNIDFIKKIMQMQTIGHDKMNMLRHVKFFGNVDNIREYMKKHAQILRPKFEICQKVLSENLNGVAKWNCPNGGYFISLDVADGTATKVVDLAGRAGVVLTEAGATFPYHKDPDDRNIRIAPSFPKVDELEKGMKVLCTCVKLAFVEKLLDN